jgi:ferrous iron transport protein A
MMNTGNTHTVAEVCGDAEIKAFLGRLGFEPGSIVTVVSEKRGNLIVSVKDSRVALTKGVANNIMV